MTTSRLWPSTNGPPSSISTTNSDIFNTAVEVTAWGYWLTGYWWWRADSGQSAGPQEFCLYAVTGVNTGILVPGSTVTSSTAFTIGAWNFVPLATPISLSRGVAYRLATGVSGNFPFTSGYWGTGGPGVNGITSGVVFGYSDATGGGGTAPDPFNNQQSLFQSNTGTDPTTGVVSVASSSFNPWVDFQVDSAGAPNGASYRLFPNNPDPLNQTLDTANNFTLGVEFSLSQTCTLDKLWFYSPATVTQLPTEVGIWNTAGDTLITATHQASPAWSGAAGSGWISVSFSSVTLPAGQYKATVFNGAGSPAIWNTSTALYWSTGPGGGGITNGPLSAPDNAHASAPGQSSYHLGTSFTFPDTNAGPYNYWVDVEVTPTGVTPGSVTSREIVRTGIAQYFGGSTYDTEARAYRGSGPLQSNGLSTVRAYQSKRMPDVDYVKGQAAGRGMGAYMIVELPRDDEKRDAKPAITGRKSISYQVILHLFHLAWQPHIEDAEQDVDLLIEAVKSLIRSDPSLSQICYQAGESRNGIRTVVYPSMVVENEKCETYARIVFDAQVEIVA